MPGLWEAKPRATVPSQSTSSGWQLLSRSKQVRTLLEGRIVVGFAITNDLRVLDISLPPEIVRDIQLRFDAVRCSEPDLSGSELDSHDQVHSLKNVAECAWQTYPAGSSQCTG